MRGRLKHAVYAGMAICTARLATCPRASVGAVVLDSKGIVRATGYNGAPRGMEHCIGDCTHNGHCVRSIHAEENALTHAAPVSVEGGTLYCTHRPCPRCQLKIIQAGIARVFYLKEYNSDAPNLLAEAGIGAYKLEFEDED